MYTIYIFILFLVNSLISIESADINQCSLDDDCNQKIMERTQKKDEKMPKRLTLVGYEAYIKTVAQEFVNGIEQYGLGNFLFDDFQTPGDINLFGNEIIGNVSFKNGFLDRIQGANINPQRGIKSNLDEKTSVGSISIGINLVKPSYMFEFEAVRPDPKPKLYGSVEITDGDVDLELASFKAFKNSSVWGKITVWGVAAQAPWDFDPPTNETELIRRQSTRKYFFMSNWQKFATTTLGEILNVIVGKLEYPRICFDCAQ